MIRYIAALWLLIATICTPASAVPLVFNTTQGGTGNAGTICGIVRGNNHHPYSAAVHGTDYMSPADVQGQSATYAADTGVANAYAVALTPVVTSYTAGLEVTFLAGHSNTGASTLALNGLAAKPMVKQGLGALIIGDVIANTIIRAVYDGTSFEIQAPSSAAGASGDIEFNLGGAFAGNSGLTYTGVGAHAATGSELFGVCLQNSVFDGPSFEMVTHFCGANDITLQTQRGCCDRVASLLLNSQAGPNATAQLTVNPNACSSYGFQACSSFKTTSMSSFGCCANSFICVTPSLITLNAHQHIRFQSPDIPGGILKTNVCSVVSSATACSDYVKPGGQTVVGITTSSANYTTLQTDNTVLDTTGATSNTQTLVTTPTTGTTQTIVKADSGAGVVTVAPGGADVIVAAGGNTLSSLGSTATYRYSAGKWFQIFKQ